MSSWEDWVDDARDEHRPDWSWRCEECNGWEARYDEDAGKDLCPDCRRAAEGASHVCAPPTPAPVGAMWYCGECPAEWRSVDVGVRFGMWNRTFAESRAQRRLAL